MPDPTLRLSAQRLRRRIAAAAYLGELSRHSALALAGAGLAALVVRRFFGWSAAQSLAWLALLAPAFATAWWFARRRFVTVATAAAWIDVELGADGRVVSAFELGHAAPHGADRLGRVAAPRIRWSFIARPFLLALAFAALALLLPIEGPQAAAMAPALVGSQIERLAEKLAALEETVDLKDELRAELQQRLDHTREQADAAPLASTFEAMDQLAQRIAQEAETAREKIDEARASLDSEALANSLAGEPAKAQEILAQTLGDMAKGGLGQNLPEGLLQDLPAGGLALPEGTPLDASQLSKLSSDLRLALDGKLGTLLKSGLIDPKKLKPFDGKLKVHKCDERCRKGGG
jgi:hypothetical protein